MAAVVASVEAEFRPLAKAWKVDPMAVSSSPQVAQPSETAGCPICHGVTSFSVENRHRPFCSARCQMVDLGNWLGERYVVPGRQNEEPEEAGRAAAEEAEES